MPTKIFRSPVEGAIFMAQQGYKLFPCIPNGKTPATKSWQKWAEESTPTRIKDYGLMHPTHNWGVLCQGLTVIDLDVKKNGIDNFKTVENALGLLPDTLKVRTTTGGYHLYLKGRTRNSVGALGEGIDTRSNGGYVIAPGSRMGELQYTIESKALTVSELPYKYMKAIASVSVKIDPLQDDELVEEGSRNSVLTSLAGTMRSRGMNFDSILAALISVNETQLDIPLPHEEVETIARSISRYKPDQAKAAADFAQQKDDAIVALNACQIDCAKIPKRDWIMYGRYIGGFISLIVSKGGGGKSSLTMLDAVAIATGKNLTGFDVIKKGGVWIYNTEDPLDEIKRRVMAISIEHKVPLSEMNNVFIVSGRDAPMVLAKSDRDNVAVNHKAIDNAVEFIKQNNIVLMLADPFVRTHKIDENNNMQVDTVAWAFQQIADRTGCAIAIVHHSNKNSNKLQTGGDMDAGRGASALAYASRVAHTMQSMTIEEAARLGIEDSRRQWYVRLDNAKANMSPPAERADWYQKINVQLENGDGVGTLRKVELADIRTAKEMEALNQEAYLFGKVLHTFFNEPDTERTIASVISKIKAAGGEYEYFFQGTLKDSVDRAISLLTLTPEGITFEDRRYTFVAYEDKRQKAWIKVEEIGVSGSIFD